MMDGGRAEARFPGVFPRADMNIYEPLGHAVQFLGATVQTYLPAFTGLPF